MPKIVDVDAKRREIAEKAVEVLIRDGIKETHFGKIAIQCGMGRTTLYEYFRNVGEIIDFALSETFEEITLGTSNLRNQPSERALTRLIRFMEYLETFAVTEKNHMVLVLDCLLHPTREMPGVSVNVQLKVRTLRAELEAILTEATNSGDLRPIDPASMAFTLFAFVEAVTIHAVIYNNVPLESTIRDINILIDGLKT